MSPQPSPASSNTDGASELSTVAQDYLKTIWTAQEWSHEKVSTKMLAERIGVSASTASESIRKLADQGLVHHEKYGAVTLTDAGRAAALAMVRRHRLLETFLVNELGYSWDEVHDEAEVLDDAPELRRFEKTLLKELGYGLTLDVEMETGLPVVAEREYTYLIERGPVQKVGDGDTAPDAVPGLRGKTLLDMAADDYADSRTRIESRQLMRQLIAHHMGGKPLQSRRVFIELQEL